MFGFVRKVNLFVPDSFLSMKTVKWEVLRSAPKELELRTKFLKLSNAVWMPWGTSEANISQNINILSDCWREREKNWANNRKETKKKRKNFPSSFTNCDILHFYHPWSEPSAIFHQALLCWFHCEPIKNIGSHLDNICCFTCRRKCSFSPTTTDLLTHHDLHTCYVLISSVTEENFFFVSTSDIHAYLSHSKSSQMFVIIRTLVRFAGLQ